MRNLRPTLLFLAGVVIYPIGATLALLFGWLACLFIKWDSVPSRDSAGLYPTIRGDLPRWLSWMGTPDERLPGGTYEPRVRSMLERHGRYWTSVYWLMRNPARGLAAKFSARPRLGDRVRGIGYPDVGAEREGVSFWMVGPAWEFYLALSLPTALVLASAVALTLGLFGLVDPLWFLVLMGATALVTFLTVTVDRLAFLAYTGPRVRIGHKLQPYVRTPPEQWAVAATPAWGQYVFSVAPLAKHDFR